MQYDLLIHSGEVIDPASGFRGPADVAVRDGRIAVIQPGLPRSGASTCVDATGCWVTPGLIDIHAHVYAGCTSWGIRPDPACLRSGVTTVVDAGSAGWTMLPGFRWYVAEPAATRVLCFLHISGIGLVNGWIGEMRVLSYGDPEAVGLLAAEQVDLVVGIKVRNGADQVGENGAEPTRLAVRAAELARLPLMVHIGRGTPLPEVLELLRPGDIVTHCFQGRGDIILDDAGRVQPYVTAARERGIVMDVGHGAGSFRWDVAERALAQGFLPDVISTDLHAYNLYGPTFDMVTTMSKFLYLGLSPEAVVTAATLAPARVIRRPDLGSLAVGGEADLAILRLEEGEVTLWDTHGGTRRAARRLVAEATVRAGQLFRTADIPAEGREAIERRAWPRRLPGSPMPPGGPLRWDPDAPPDEE
jgi:dihydroorotase